MLSTANEGVFTKTQAFNYLKDLLSIPKKSTINKNFFRLFFKSADGLYMLKTSEEMIAEIFSEEGLVKLNSQYFELKKENLPAAKVLKSQIFSTVKNRLTVV
jgi:hypothetical protein